MSAHAILAPSSAARWVACAGSVLLAALYPETEESPEAAEGTATHWAAQELLAGRAIDVGLVAPNGVVLSDEMAEGAEMYVDHIDDTLKRFGLDRSALRVEQRVSISAIHSENWGTPDAWFYDHATRTLVIFDFKFGHRFIEVFENWQLIDYAAGIVDGLGLDDQATRVEFWIVQPRSYHRDGPVRSWSTVASDLRALWNKLRNAAEAAMRPGAACTPNPECEYCPGRHACEAAQNAAYRAADLARSSVPLELDAGAISLELRILQRAEQAIKARRTGLEEQALNRLKRGEAIPGLATESTTGREAWSKPVPEVVALGQLFSIDLVKPATITPAQARKAGLPAGIVAAYAERPARGLALVYDDGTQARKVFGK
ncbi:MAG TPA: DUF2800 domain-containing protein [Acidimicrobiales bacterium]|nr:DUF2800 domain-containing protein [Acidimicrobiales bacterium]